MENEHQLQFKPYIFSIPSILLLVIWMVYWIEIQFGFNFNSLGIFPRTLHGFKGVFLAHFIHGNAKHLFNNSIPLFVLMSGIFYFYREVATKVLIFGTFFTGLITWIIARESYHIGASGIIYLLFSFILFSGIIRKQYRLMAFSFIIIFLYGSMIWYVLPIEEGMSWEGHLSGFITGAVLSVVYKNTGIVKEEFEFSPSEIDTFFDENGNIIEELIEKD